MRLLSVSKGLTYSEIIPTLGPVITIGTLALDTNGEVADDPSILNLRYLGWRRLGSPLDVLLIESLFLILWVIVILRVVW